MPRPDPHAFDDDNPELTDEHLANLKPASTVFTPEQIASLSAKRGPGRPPKADRKEAVKLRIDPEVLAFFKAKGPGWQTRMHQALERAMREG